MDGTNTRNFDRRKFIAAIRRRLDAGGQRMIEVSRSWIDDTVPGEIFTLNVPLGASLVAPLTPLADVLEIDDAEGLEFHAAYFAQALVNLNRGSAALTRYVASIRKAVETELAIARDLGSDVGLERIGLHPVCAWDLNGKSWKDAIGYIWASVGLRNTSSVLRPAVETVRIGAASSVAHQLVDFLERERDRRYRIDKLDAADADIEVDAVTLDLLSIHGFDVTRELRRACRKQQVTLPVGQIGQDNELTLFNWYGWVTSSIALEQGHWNGELFRYSGAVGAGPIDIRAGTCLGDLVPHPAFTSRTIAGVEDGACRIIDFAVEAPFLFDADSGRLWRPERRLAA